MHYTGFKTSKVRVTCREPVEVVTSGHFSRVSYSHGELGLSLNLRTL